MNSDRPILIPVKPGSESPEAGKRRMCRKCLLQDMPESEYFREMAAQIAAMDPRYKVEDEVYQQRLDKCRCCEFLQEGMCRICGCYVEWRASMKIKSCPLVHARWQAHTDEDE